jgi:hypothetical protein
MTARYRGGRQRQPVQTGAPGERFLLDGVGDRGPRRGIFARWGGRPGPPASDFCSMGWETGAPGKLAPGLLGGDRLSCLPPPEQPEQPRKRLSSRARKAAVIPCAPKRLSSRVQRKQLSSRARKSGCHPECSEGSAVAFGADRIRGNRSLRIAGNSPGIARLASQTRDSRPGDLALFQKVAGPCEVCRYESEELQWHVRRITECARGRSQSAAPLVWCAQHGRTLTGASPVTSWSQ